jgi:sortase A
VSSRLSRVLKSFVTYEVAAWCLTLVCATALLTVKIEANATRNTASRIANVRADGAQSREISPVNQGTLAVINKSPLVNGVMGRLEIHSIGLTVPILDGFDPSDLRKGVGHIHGTAMPGGLGNMALAGHRDTFFRPLRNIRQGMIASVFTADGRYDYVIDSTSIVDPDKVSVLAIRDVPEMTLITCYPFDYIGSAPHRFIARAHLKSIEPASN